MGNEYYLPVLVNNWLYDNEEGMPLFLISSIMSKLGFDVVSSFNAIARIGTLQMGLCMSKHDNDGESSYHNMELAGGNVHLITTKQSWDEKLSQASREGRIVVANFSAAWCGPCRVIAPFYSELSEKHPSLMFLTIDVDELTELSTSWDIKATPTFFFLRDGQQIEKLVGANKPELQKKITAVSDSIGKCEK